MNPLADYELNTAYGVSAVPFQAIRTICQLALNHKKGYPLASSALLHYCYIEDIVSGANSLEEALNLQQEIISILNNGQFELRK